MMRPTLLAVSVLSVACGACAADVPLLGHTAHLATIELASKTTPALTVTSAAFGQGADIPFENTQYRGNIFPGLDWSQGPAGTQTYLVIVQGEPERAGAMTSIHLTLYNIPAGSQNLPVGMTNAPAGTTYGPNVHGVTAAYAGPHTHTLQKQAYHFQVLALDTQLPVVAGQSFDAIEAAARGHVLASGDLTGYASMDPQSPEAAKLRDAAK
jgi:para-nitrobenzyl esterase